MDIEGQKKKLNSDIKLFTRIGATSAFIALIPLIWAGIQVLWNHKFFIENELGDFIGGTSGTFASFAGLAFVYVAFLGQRLQILMQQEELELNRKELQETREEIKGQKEQLELQNKFNSDSQKINKLFKLFDSYIIVRSGVHYSNYILHEIKMKEYLNSPASLDDINGEFRPKLEKVYQEDAFKNVLFNLKKWVDKQWKYSAPENFFLINNYEYIPKRDDFTWENASKEELFFLIKAIVNEESLGAYFRILIVILDYSINSGLKDELKLIEALMGKDERILVFYWLYSQKQNSLISQLKQNNFLFSVSKKHLLSFYHYDFLIE